MVTQVAGRQDYSVGPNRGTVIEPPWLKKMKTKILQTRLQRFSNTMDAKDGFNDAMF